MLSTSKSDIFWQKEVLAKQFLLFFVLFDSTKETEYTLSARESTPSIFIVVSELFPLSALPVFLHAVLFQFLPGAWFCYLDDAGNSSLFQTLVRTNPFLPSFPSSRFQFLNPAVMLDWFKQSQKLSVAMSYSVQQACQGPKLVCTHFRSIHL